MGDSTLLFQPKVLVKKRHLSQEIELDQDSISPEKLVDEEYDHGMHKIGLNFEADFKYEPAAIQNLPYEQGMPRLRIDYASVEGPMSPSAGSGVLGKDISAEPPNLTPDPSGGRDASVSNESKREMETSNLLVAGESRAPHGEPSRVDSAQNSVIGDIQQLHSPNRDFENDKHASDEADDAYSNVSEDSEEISTDEPGCYAKGKATRYLHWEWSEALHLYYCHIFGEDDTIIEALWSNPRQPSTAQAAGFTAAPQISSDER